MVKPEPLRGAHLLWLLGSIVATVGLLLPLAHPFRESFSGRSLGTYEVLDGTSRGVEIDLDRTMNPLGIRAIARVAPSLKTVGYGYRATLYLDKAVVGTHTFSFLADKESVVFSEAALMMFSVQVDARHRIVVEGHGNPDGVQSLSIDVRRNAKLLSWWNTLLWAVGLLVGGWLITVFGEKPPFIQRYEDNTKASRFDET